jgi:hypothetical protein
MGFEQFPQFFFRSIEVEVPNENIFHASTSKVSYLRAADFGGIIEGWLAVLQPEQMNSQMRGKYSRSITDGKLLRRKSAPLLTILDSPITFPLITNLQQAILRIVPFFAFRTLQITSPRRPLTIVIFRHGKGRTATAGNDKHLDSLVVFLDCANH